MREVSEGTSPNFGKDLSGAVVSAAEPMTDASRVARPSRKQRSGQVSEGDISMHFSASSVAELRQIDVGGIGEGEHVAETSASSSAMANPLRGPEFALRFFRR